LTGKNNELDWLNQPHREINKPLLIGIGAVLTAQGIVLMSSTEVFGVYFYTITIMLSFLGMLGTFYLGRLSGLKEEVPKRTEAYDRYFTLLDKQEAGPNGKVLP
jgi:hypothetical protein